jgi:hypothetical protein
MSAGSVTKAVALARRATGFSIKVLLQLVELVNYAVPFAFKNHHSLCTLNNHHNLCIFGWDSLQDSLGVSSMLYSLLRKCTLAA